MNKFGVLREISDDDLELMLSWRNAPAVRANMYTQHEISLAEHLAWWERVKNQSDQKYFMYEIFGKPNGIVALTSLNAKNKNSGWAFYTSPMAPIGTGSRMEFLVLEYFFSFLKFHKLYCEVLAFNSSVIKLHQKFGFKVEGIFRDHCILSNGFVDVYRLGILAEEWQGQRQIMHEKLISQFRFS